MITGIDISETFDYISPSDKSEPKTVFKVGVIPTIVMASIRDQSRIVMVDLQTMDGKTPVRTNIAEMQLNYVRHGLKGWSNLKDKRGNVLTFTTKKTTLAGREIDIVSDESLNQIPDDIIQELSEKIRDLNTLSSEEIKN
jgi:hypothetical protein